MLLASNAHTHEQHRYLSKMFLAGPCLRLCLDHATQEGLVLLYVPLGQH